MPSIRRVLIPRLTPGQLRWWDRANRSVLWGWKRDIGLESRLVYFSARLERRGTAVLLGRCCFRYRTVTDPASARSLLGALEDCRDTFAALNANPELRVSNHHERRVLEFSFGWPMAADLDRIRRLKLRRPRRRMWPPDFPRPAPVRPAPGLFPADLYVGSGVSYEAGLPTLCQMHEAFAVDCPETDDFMVGARDRLPRHLADEPAARLGRFCAVHVGAILREPTPAMWAIGQLQQAGLIRKVFTDNVDNMLAKVNCRFERVRGSGVFNERFPAVFSSPTLIVVGVAADRRQIISQARRRRMRICVVNPCTKVSPNVTHLDYLRSADLFYRAEAREFFQRVALIPRRTAA